MATTAKATKKKRKRGDSPITVGGGGGHKTRNKDTRNVDIAFDHNDLVAEGSKTYQMKGEVLRGLHVDGLPKTVNASSTVTITCRNPSSGKDSRVVIYGDPYGVSFNPDDYPYDFATKKHTSSKSPKPRIIVDVDIDGTSVEPLEEFPTVKAHNIAVKRGKRGRSR
jgi:hypothetical protein